MQNLDIGLQKIFGGNNYAYEASEKLLEHAFEDLKLNKIFASFKKAIINQKEFLKN